MHVYICTVPAKVPCKHVVELARASLATNPDAGLPIREFAAIRPADAEVGVHKVLQKYHLSPKIKIDLENLTDDPEMKGFPLVKLSSWIRFLFETGRLFRQFCGVNSFRKMAMVLQEFWKRYEAINENHEVFDLARRGQLDLRYTIPFYSHTDEGRSYKHEAIWILSCHCAIGRGSRNYLKRNRHRCGITTNEMGLNFVGHTMSTQFFIASILRRAINNHPGCLNALLRIFAEDCACLASEGVSFGNKRVWLIHLGTKGDLPALVKVGSMTRSFSHTPRAARSKTAASGICHLCLAGQEGDVNRGQVAYAFEDVSVSPCWEATMHTVEPWEAEPVILRGIPLNPQKKASFFCLDIWHCWHLGLAKHWIASSFVLIVESNLLEQTSIETKFAFVTQKFKEFCRAGKHPMWLRELNRESFSWPQSSACPVGRWNKGSFSTTMLLFLDDFCKNIICGHSSDPLLLMIVPCLAYGANIFKQLFFHCFVFSLAHEWFFLYGGSCI